MSLDAFLTQFGGDGAASELNPALPQDDGRALQPNWLERSQPGALDQFLTQFNGQTEPYYFYYVDGKPTVELRYNDEEHIYYLVGELGQLTPRDGVTNTCHIIDKSPARIPWAAKKVIEKLWRLMPSITFDPETGKFGPPQFIPQMVWEEFEQLCLEAKTAPRDKLEEAGDIGHMAHTWLEYYIKAVIAKHQLEIESKLLNLPKDERAANCVRAALKWMEAHKVKWIETERKIYSKKYGYAGTMDGLALVSSCNDPACKGCRSEVFTDRLSIIDWKSSNYLYVEYLYQTAAYESAYEEEFGVDVKDRWILRLGKEDGEFEPWHTTTEDFQEDFEGFLDALSLSRSVTLTTERMRGQKKIAKELAKEAKLRAKEAEKLARKEARKQATAERRAAKAAEKELLKAKKKAERAAMKANLGAAIGYGSDAAIKKAAEAIVLPTEAVDVASIPLPTEKIQ